MAIVTGYPATSSVVQRGSIDFHLSNDQGGDKGVLTSLTVQRIGADKVSRSFNAWSVLRESYNSMPRRSEAEPR